MPSAAEVINITDADYRKGEALLWQWGASHDRLSHDYGYADSTIEYRLRMGTAGITAPYLPGRMTMTEAQAEQMGKPWSVHMVMRDLSEGIKRVCEMRYSGKMTKVEIARETGFDRKVVKAFIDEAVYTVASRVI